jgi:hypothetical protein
MSPLFKHSGDDLPLVYDIDYDAFLKYKGSWLLWRSLGRRDASGNWEPPLSFVEADQLPKDKIDFFLSMDEVFRKKLAQLSKKKTNRK